MRILIPGRLASLRKNSGITLIELLVALAIVGVIVALATSGLRTALNVELKSSARELGSLIRYVRSKAITEHKYLRLALDFGESEYWVEVSADPFVISSEEDDSKESKEKKGKGKGKEAEAVPEENPEEGVPEEKKKFEEIEDDTLLRRRKLGSGVFFKDVTVGYLPEKKTEGVLYLYFFPDGYATEGMINLRDEGDEDHFSVEVMSLSGGVNIQGEYRDLEKKE
ncbi:MAG: prepilin-type N-terminal cleavage/methylation domain-containing protein [Deltaproteobacteria bacterium]|nr:prepilin-type N-terminal cleavage/methylation domain-containing protein [Deltaproteobacteria bacterium]